MITEGLPTTRGLGRDAWRYAARRTLHGFIRHRGLDAAAALTFYSTLTLFPASLTVVSVFALAGGGSAAAVDRLAALLEGVLPASDVEAARTPLESFLTIPSPGYALVIGLAGSVWTVSSYLTAFGRAMNTVYEVEEGRPFWAFRPRMMVLSLVLILAFALVIGLLLVTPSVAQAVAEAAGVAAGWALAFTIAKWPALAALGFAIIALLYYGTPNVRRLRLRWVSLGALFALVFWSLATSGFAVYVLTVDSYNRVYGWVGGAVVVLVWFYLSNLVLVIGAEADAEIVRIRQLAAGVAAETAIRLPLRDTRRALALARHRAADESEGRALRDRSSP
ncbi:MAG: YihY/virulence factor BrkB family protein [Microbacteriaceae bacterium]